MLFCSIYNPSPVYTSLTVSNLTAGRVTYAGTAGLLTDSANLTFNGTALKVNADLNLAAGSITSDSGAIDFGNETLTTTGIIGIGIAPNAVVGMMLFFANSSVYNGINTSMQYLGTNYVSRGVYCAAYGRNTVTTNCYVYGGDFTAIAFGGSFINPANVRTVFTYGGKFISRDYTGFTYTKTGSGKYEFCAGNFDMQTALGNWTTNNPVVTSYGVKIEAAPTGYGSNHTHWSLASISGNCYFGGSLRIGSSVVPTVALDVTGAGLFSTTLGVTGLITATGGIVAVAGFGCNGATIQTAYASGGAAATTAGDFGFGSDAERIALTTLVANIRLALVANGILS